MTQVFAIYSGSKFKEYRRAATLAAADAYAARTYTWGCASLIRGRGAVGEFGHHSPEAVKQQAAAEPIPNL